MCEIVDKLLNLMKPFVENIEDDFNYLKTKENAFNDVKRILDVIDNNVLNVLNVEIGNISLYIKNFNSNVSEYEANKYILQSDIDEVKNLPQYASAQKYLDNFYKYLLNYYNELDDEYQKIKDAYNEKELVNKYYVMINNNNVFIDDVNEIKEVFSILGLSFEEKNESLIYILKENSKSYNQIKSSDVFSDDINKKAVKLLEENNNLKNGEYNELLDAVSEYVDISKSINDIIDYDLIGKINISNILLAKKVWLYRKINFLYFNMNCEKCSKVLDEFNLVEKIYEKIKNIRDQNEMVRIIKEEE